MKPRHAAALALVGWYLMLPPAKAADKSVPDLGAPLSRWHVDSAWDYALACDNELRALRERTIQEHSLLKSLIPFAMAGQCVATDDPRLKGN